MRAIVPGVLAAALLLPSVDAHAQASETSFALSLPAQSLRDALNNLAGQTGLQIIYTADDVAPDLLAPQLDGRFTPAAALETLLKNTGLTFEFLNPRTVAIGDGSTSAPTGTVRTSKLSASSAASNIVLARAEGGEPVSSSTDHTALAGEASDDAQPVRLEEIVVTGSRLRRVEDEGASPVRIIDRSEIDRSGASTVADVLAYLPQQSFVDQEQNTFNGARSVRLRGLGLGTTLVLINGRRTTSSALQGTFNYFDLGTVPLAAVDRIEVLADSASAIYGADAVGGAVNIVLKSDVSEPFVEMSYGSAHGGGEEVRVAAGFGVSSDRTRVSLVFDYLDRGVLLGEEREQYTNQDLTRFGGAFDFRSTASKPGNVSTLDGQPLPGLSAPFAAVPLHSSGTVKAEDFAATDGEVRLDSLARYQGILSSSERIGAFATGELDVSDEVTAYAEWMVSHREERLPLNPPVLNSAPVSSSNPFNPFGVDVAVSYLFSELPGQASIVDSEFARGVAGMRFALGDWDADIGAVYVHDNARNWRINALDPVRVETALNATVPQEALNVFSSGPAGSPALLASLAAPVKVDRFKGESVQIGGFVRGPLLRLPTGEVQAVFGAEWRTEALDLDIVTGGLSLGPSRETYAIYSEVGIPILEGSDSSSRQLAATLAARYDHYSDFGSTFNPQFGLEYRPLNGLLLRASYGESFRAPSLFELYAPRFPSSIQIFDSRRNNESYIIDTVAGGNPNLDPEIGESLNVGFVWTSKSERDLRIEGTYWRVQQDLRVSRFNHSLLLANEALFPERVVRAPSTPADTAAGIPGVIQHIDQTSLNYGSLDASGIDWRLAMTLNSNWGQWVPAVAGTWVSRYETAELPGTPAIDRVGVASNLGTIPRFRATGSLMWSRAGLSLTGTVRYTSPYDDVDLFGSRNDRRIDGQYLVDIQGSADLGGLLPSLRLADAAVLRLGARNILDRRPQYSEVSYLGFDFTQSDIVGRYWYAGLSKRF